MVKKLNKEQLYFAVFFQLDRYYELNKEEIEKGLFSAIISGMDPFIFTGLEPADSAMGDDFSECFEKTFGNRLVSYDEGFNFIKTYLHLYEGVYDCNSEYIFSQLSRKDWEKCCDYAIEFLKEHKK